MKKTVRMMAMLLMTLLMVMPVSAYQTRSQKFKSVALTGDHASDMVAVAKGQRGLGNLGYTEAWCADFVLDCAKKAGIPTSIIPSNNGNCANCGYFYNRMTQMGASKVSASAAKPGDLVFYYCSSCRAYKHVGIYAGGGYFIEGNMSDRVLLYNTWFNDTKGHSTRNGTIQRVFVRPNYIDYNVANAKVALSTTTYTYNMLAHQPVVNVQANGTTLKLYTDYTVQYFNTVNAGTASVRITGKGKYYGSRTVNYTIRPYSISGLSGFSVSDQVYTGKQLKPGVRFSGSKTLAKMITASGNMKVSYGANTKMGLGTVTISGTRNLTGTKTLTFRICPKKVTSLSTTIRGGRVTLKWGILAGTGGYEVAYRKANASAWTTRTSGGASCVLQLNRLTKYQVRVRAYITVNGQRVYGAWSDTTTFTTKLF